MYPPQWWQVTAKKIIFHLVITSRNIFFAFCYLFIDRADVIEVNVCLNDVGITSITRRDFQFSSS